VIKPLSEPSVKIVLIAQKLITLLASGCVAAVVLSTIAYQRKRSWDTLNGMDGYCVRLRVIGGNAPGGFAQLTSVPASAVHKVPEGKYSEVL